MAAGSDTHFLIRTYGAAFDNPNLIVVCIVGDGEAETESLALAGFSNRGNDLVV